MTTSEQTLPNGEIDELLHRSQEMARELITSDGRRRSGVQTLVGAVEVMDVRYKDLAERMAGVQAELRLARSEVVNLQEVIQTGKDRFDTLSAQNAKLMHEFDAFIDEIGRRTQQTLEDDRVIEAAVAMTAANARFGDELVDTNDFNPASHAREPEHRMTARRDFNDAAGTPVPEVAPMPSFLRPVGSNAPVAIDPDHAASATTFVSGDADYIDHENMGSDTGSSTDAAEERSTIRTLASGFAQLARRGGTNS